MIQRLLLFGGILGVLIGGSGATAAALVTTANAAVRQVHATDGRHISSALTSSTTPGVSPSPAAIPMLAATPALPPVASAASTPHDQGNLRTGATAAPAPVATATSAPHPQRNPRTGAAAAPALVATAASAPRPQRNRLTGPHGLNAPVGPDYTDCTGNREVSHAAASRDTCYTGAVLFVGHNQGLFTPLLRFVRGDVIDWYDGNGAVHRLQIVAVRDVSSAAFPTVLGPYEFQTCLYPVSNSPANRELDAVEV